MKISAALLPLLALGLAPSAGVAAFPQSHAATAAEDAQTLLDANARLKAQVEATAPGGRLPLLGNQDAALVRTAFDAVIIRAAPLDAGTIGSICEALGNSILAYTDYVERTAGNEVAAQNAEVIRLQDEFALGTAAANICVQRGFRAIDALLGTFDTARRSQLGSPLMMMRNGTTMTISGTLATLELPGISAANQDLMVFAMAEDSAVVAASFPKAERGKLERMVRDSASRATRLALKQALNRIAQSFASPACNTLCQAAGG